MTKKETEMSVRERVMAVAKPGMSHREIARLAGCTKFSVTYHLSEKYREQCRLRKKTASESTTYKLKMSRGGACQHCGFSETLFALDWHHVDPSKKKFSVSEGRAGNYERAKAESEKCVLVCKNCHVMIHKNLIPCPRLP
jgi:hypothetical protein